MTEEIGWGRVETAKVGIGHLGERDVREEAVIEEASLEKEVDQGIKGVPDEEHAIARRCGGMEDSAGHSDSYRQEDDGCGQGDEGSLVEQIRRQA